MQVGVNLRDNGEWSSLYDVVVSWLRLQTPIDCFPHPYWMYTKVFQHLEMLWMGIWGHPYALIHVQVGVNFWKTGVWQSLNVVEVSCLRPKSPIDCIPHPYWMYTKPQQRYCGWMHHHCEWDPGHTASYCGWAAEVRRLQDRGFPTHGDAKESCWGKKIWTWLLQCLHACRRSGRWDFYRQSGELRMSGCTICDCAWLWIVQEFKRAKHSKGVKEVCYWGMWQISTEWL